TDDRIPGISAPAPAAATLVKNVRLLSDMRGSLAQIPNTNDQIPNSCWELGLGIWVLGFAEMPFGYTPPRTTIYEDDLGRHGHRCVGCRVPGRPAAVAAARGRGGRRSPPASAK